MAPAGQGGPGGPGEQRRHQAPVHVHGDALHGAVAHLGNVHDWWLQRF